MKKRTVATLAVAAAVLLAGAAGWRLVSVRQASTQAQAGAVRAEAFAELAPTDVVKVAPLALAQGLPISGSLRAVDSAFVKARVAGELQGLAVREGDAVRAGQPIGRIDPTESQSRLRQAREQAEAARAQVEIAQRQFDNNRALVEQGFISRTALEASQSSLVAAQASHRAALAAVELATKGLDDTELRSPIAGTVAQRLAQPGERIAVDTRVIEVVDLRRLELEAAISATDSPQVRVGQRALLQVEGAAGPVDARVARINPSAQPGSRSVLVYLAVDGAAGLRQGLFAEGRLGTGQASALALPLSAVLTDKPEPYVQTVEDGRVAHRAVRLGGRGERDRQPFVAVEGVPEGTPVLLGHVGVLREGLAVRFTQAPAPAAPAAAPRTAP